MAHTPCRAARVHIRGAALFHGTAFDSGFYAYYRLGRGGEPADARREPRGKTDKAKARNREELTTHYEPSHSLFGIIWQIASATGWSVHYILWEVNYQTLAMMMADAPRTTTEQTAETPPKSIEQLFQSKYKSKCNPSK